MIYVISPDVNVPVGGIKILYRHVDVLQQIGLPSTIVHESAGFRCTWFENSTPVLHAAKFRPSAEDWIVIPEIYWPDMASREPGVPKVVFNQNGSLTFSQYPVTGSATSTDYCSQGVTATLVISDHVERYVRTAFPDMPTIRARCSIEGDMFRFEPRKARQICFMPRKHPEEAREVFNLLRCRGALEGFDVVAIDNVPQAEVARIMRESMFFFSFGYPEGFSLPPAEAMACGCVVVGYHGFGGEEYFRDDVCHAVPTGDVLQFASAAEQVLEEARRHPQEVVARGQRASEYILSKY